MNVLILGGGGREHALAWKMAQSPYCDKLFIAPGNPGTAQHGANLDIGVSDFAQIADAVAEYEVELVVVGPEVPLVAGIVDYLADKLPEVAVIGPDRAGAQLEGSKAFAKSFMAEYGVPTAGYREFSAAQVEEGVAYLATQPPPYVLKADGLAAGKGVLILEDLSTAQQELRAMLSGKFGAAGHTVVIEEFLDGLEFSVFVLTDGQDYRILPVAKDYKRIGEGDTGLNTGGMGAVSPVPFVTQDVLARVEESIVRPTVRGIGARGFRYKGIVFIGCILVDGLPYVIEYNCRLGDPETEVILPRLNNDLLLLFLATHRGQLSEQRIDLDPRVAATVMLVSGGYPEAYQKGKPISGVESIRDSIPFHAGTRQEGNRLLTNGGRVLALTSYGDTYTEALTTSLRHAEQVTFDGKNYRKDIGFDL